MVKHRHYKQMQA